MKLMLLALAACAAASTALAQPDQYGWRHDPRRERLSPEVREALRDYCRIMRARHARNSAVAIPPLCYRLFPVYRAPGPRG